MLIWILAENPFSAGIFELFMRFFLFFLVLGTSLFSKPKAFYLSWYDDPTKTMAVQWILSEKDPEETLFLKTSENTWTPFQGESKREGPYLVYFSHVKDLASDKLYYFKFGEKGDIYSFKTAPKNLKNPFSFLVGGDVYQSKKIFQKMSRQVMKQDPLFAVLGGDLAYALDHFKLRSKPLNRWVSFFESWQEKMMTKEKRVIPLIAVPGNHDIKPDQYELFFTFFAFPDKKLYRALDFGHYLSLILLDTGHFQPIKGRQSLWLKKALKNHTSYPYLFAIYHESAYPSYYSYDSIKAKKVRMHWVPLFEEFHVSAVFEHHNHAFKKTHPLKKNKIDPSGIVYFGDGGWGAVSRAPKEHWYLEEKGKINSVYLVELSLEKAKIKLIDLRGNVVEKQSIFPR